MDFHHAPKQAQKVIKTESPGADAVHGVSLETDRSICIERTAVIDRLITVWDSRSSGWQLAGICGNLSRILTIVQLSVVHGFSKNTRKTYKKDSQKNSGAIAPEKTVEPKKHGTKINL